MHTDRESDNGQAAGKAFMLEHIISQLDSMASGASMADVALAYSVGEASELWQQVLSKLAVAD